MTAPTNAKTTRADAALIDWRDMPSAPQDGSWVHLKVRAFGEEYVSNHYWCWANSAWHSPHYPLTAYSAQPVAWSPA